jgi:hypothetical protein
MTRSMNNLKLHYRLPLVCSDAETLALIACRARNFKLLRTPEPEFLNFLGFQASIHKTDSLKELNSVVELILEKGEGGLENVFDSSLKN